MIASLLDDGYLDQIREKVLADLYHIMLPIGIAGNIAAHVRNLSLGIPFGVSLNTSFITLLLVTLVAAHWRRRTIPPWARTVLLVGIMDIAALLSGLTMGVHSPFVFMTPAAVMLGWLLLGSRAGIALAIIDICALAAIAWLHITGVFEVSSASRLDPGLSHWIIVGASQLITGGVILVAVLRLLEAAKDRQAALTALTAELESRVVLRTQSLEKAREEMQAFAYAVSHDLRAPLRAIDGFSRVLAEDEQERLSPDGQDALRRILAGTTRMNRLIDALLGLSRLDRAQVHIQPVDMERLVRQLREELGIRDIEWVIGRLPPCSTDPDLARLVFQNILSNAAKFSAVSTPPRIEVFAEERDDGIWYCVRDNGTGFDMAHSKQLFRMFQRLHDASYDGLGIGLATVKRVLERLEGAIEANGEPGRGATFAFRPTPAAGCSPSLGHSNPQ